MAKIRLTKLYVEYGNINRVVEAVRSDGSSTLRGLKSASIAYVRFLKERFLRNAQGGGAWRALTPKYKKKKPYNKHLILILTGSLYEGITYRKSRSRTHPSYIVGYVHGRSHYSGFTLRRLADIHQNEGIVRSDGVVKRTIMVEPSSQVRQEMVDYIQRGIDADIRRSNRGR